MQDEIELHDYESLHNESKTGLTISRMKVHNGWIYLFAYPLGLETTFVPESKQS